MNMHAATARALSCVGLGALFLAPLQASGQSVFSSPKSVAAAFATPPTPPSTYVPEAAFGLGSYYQSRQSWHDLAFAAGAVALIGILQDDSTLTVIGTVGLLFCLVQSDQGRSFHLSPQGFEFVDANGFHAGLTPFGFADPLHGPAPAGYVGYSLRF